MIPSIQKMKTGDIPVSFHLFGEEIRVEYRVDLRYKEDWSGTAEFRQNRILLQAPSDATPTPTDKLVHTFLHELVHFLLFCAEEADEPELHTRERLVDRLSGLLHQALTTMQFQEETEK